MHHHWWVVPCALGSANFRRGYVHAHIYSCLAVQVGRVRVARVGHAGRVGRVGPGCVSCSCRVGVIRAVLGFGGTCRVAMSVFACLCRLCPALIYMYIYIYIYIYIYSYVYVYYPDALRANLPPRFF